MSKIFTFAERIRQDILLLSINEDFLADIKKLQKEYNIPKSNEDVNYKGFPVIYDNKNFSKDRNAIMKKYVLPESHEFALTGFLLDSNININDDFSENFWHLNPSWVSIGKEYCITLKIYPDTSLKDIQRNWPRIKKAKDCLLKHPIKRKNKSKNLDRDILIYKLKKEGKKIKDITKIINGNKRFGKQLVAYEEIPKIIKRLKEKAKKIIPTKET